MDFGIVAMLCHDCLRVFKAIRYFLATETALKGAPAPFSLVIFDLLGKLTVPTCKKRLNLPNGAPDSEFPHLTANYHFSSVAASIPVSHAGRLRLKPSTFHNE